MTAPRTSRITRRVQAQTRARARDRRRGRRHVIDQDLFRDALIRERRRADRFDQPFLLLLVTLKNGMSERAWASTIEALMAAKRETEVLGWFERGSVLGLILLEVDATDAGVTREIDARVRRDLAAKLDAETLARCSIRLHVHSGSNAAASQGVSRGDPLALTARRHKARAAVHQAVKRGLDVIGSLTLLAVLSPLFLIVAVLVKRTSAGPVFFSQVRVGETAKPFTMLKFRTMQVHNDEAIHQEYVTQFIKSNSPVESGNAAVFKIVNDPRVTPIGHFLRKTSIDELPQFWNVLRGEMSLVGPRPPLPYEVAQYKRWHHRRVLEAKPGITGLWQVTGRSRTTFDEMVRLDLRYARTCSLWTDIKILLATPRAVISGKGAR